MAQTQITTPLRGVFRRANDGETSEAVADGAPVAQGDVVGYIEIHGQYNQLASEVEGSEIQFAVNDGDKLNPGDVVANVEA